MDKRRQTQGTDPNAHVMRPRGRELLLSPGASLVYSLLMTLCVAGATVSAEPPAETPLRNSFDRAEMKLMAGTSLDYTTCLQQQARENLDSSPDVRVIAGNAVQACEPLLTDLQSSLHENRVNPRFYMAAVTRMKNRAIRRLLPLLMMEKSNQHPVQAP